MHILCMYTHTNIYIYIYIYVFFLVCRQSWAALLWNVAALPLPLHPLDYSGATATVTCSAATLAATMAKIIENL